MPAVSKAQQRFMGMVRATQKGEMKNPSPEVQDAANSMKKKDAKDFASTKHKGLPEKKKVEEAVYGGAFWHCFIHEGINLFLFLDKSHQFSNNLIQNIINMFSTF